MPIEAKNQKLFFDTEIPWEREIPVSNEFES